MHRVDVEQADGTAIVRGAGELDAFAAPDLTAAFERVSDGGRVLVDLAAVSFMDSTALGVVARRVRELRQIGGEVRVVLPETPARRIFEITTLDRALPVAASRETALGELSG